MNNYTTCLLKHSTNLSFPVHKINILLVFWVFGVLPWAAAQDIPLGTWRTHAAYLPATQLAIADQRVYVASATGFFYYDLQDNSLKTLSKIDGFSETNISALAYHSGTQSLVIGYQSGNIDILRNGRITNIPTLLVANLTGSKQIRHISFRGNTAFLATSVGLLVLDLVRLEIRETYRNIGTNGTSVQFFASGVSQDSLFVATSAGVLRASLATQANLQDFTSWRSFTPTSGIGTQPPLWLTVRNNQVYVSINGVGIRKYTHQGQWSALALPALSTVNDLSTAQNQVFICQPGRLWLLDLADNLQAFTDSRLTNPQKATQNGAGAIWVADLQNGFVTNLSGGFASIRPNGLARNEAWQLYTLPQTIGLTTGGYTSTLAASNNLGGFAEFRQGEWRSFTAYDALNTTPIPALRDIVSAAFDPRTQATYWASFRDGLLRRNGATQGFDRITNTTAGSLLQAQPSGDVSITSVAVSPNGDLWVANPNPSATDVVVLRANGTWQGFVGINAAAQNPVEIFIDSQNQKWIRLNPAQGGGIWLLDDVRPRSRYLSATLAEGNLLSNTVLCITQDVEGQVWIGTDQGVNVFSNPANAFNTNFTAFTPVFGNRPLLRGEQIQTIAVDGGNRKWIGTTTGAWLFSPDGRSQILNFTTQNSPLPSDNILDIAIEPISGEVFFATDKGLVSYRGTATLRSDANGSIKVFPNPVTPNFTGLLGISGLAADAIVKITDINGGLVYETRSNGGTAVWNLIDFRGERVNTGIYLIFAAQEDGSAAVVTKLAVVE